MHSKCRLKHSKHTSNVLRLWMKSTWKDWIFLSIDFKPSVIMKRDSICGIFESRKPLSFWGALWCSQCSGSFYHPHQDMEATATNDCCFLPQPAYLSIYLPVSAALSMANSCQLDVGFTRWPKVDLFDRGFHSVIKYLTTL